MSVGFQIVFKGGSVKCFCFFSVIQFEEIGYTVCIETIFPVFCLETEITEIDRALRFCSFSLFRVKNQIDCNGERFCYDIRFILVIEVDICITGITDLDLILVCPVDRACLRDAGRVFILKDISLEGKELLINVNPGIGNLESHCAADRLAVELAEGPVNAVAFVGMRSRHCILIEILGRTVRQFSAVMDGEISHVGPIVQRQRLGIRIPGIAGRIYLLAGAVGDIGLVNLFPDIVIGIAAGGFPLDFDVLVPKVVIVYAIKGIFDCIRTVIVDGRLFCTGIFTVSLQIQIFCNRSVEVISSPVQLPFSEHLPADRRICRFCRFPVLLNLLCVCNIVAFILEINMVTDRKMRIQRNALCDRRIEIIRLPVQIPCAEFLSVIPRRDLIGFGHFMARNNEDPALFI